MLSKMKSKSNRIRHMRDSPFQLEAMHGHSAIELNRTEDANECNNRRHQISSIVNRFVFSCIVFVPRIHISLTLRNSVQSTACIDSSTFAFCCRFRHRSENRRESDCHYRLIKCIARHRICRLIIFKNV